MLLLNNVSAGYGGEDIIRNISFSVEGNIAIVGPNGCGKTTLLKAIANILQFRGDILLHNKPLSGMKPRELALCIAMLSQQPNIYFSYSVFDTVMMGRYLHMQGNISKSPSARDRAAVIEALEVVNLLNEKDEDITKLSGGQLQRVFLARALAQEPSIILLDEPTNHLDLKCQIEIIKYLEEWAKQGDRAIVAVLHDINLAIQLSGRLIVMKDGKILADGGAEEIIKNGLLDHAYGMNVAEYMRSSLEIWS